MTSAALAIGTIGSAAVGSVPAAAAVRTSHQAVSRDFRPIRSMPSRLAAAPPASAGMQAPQTSGLACNSQFNVVEGPVVSVYQAIFNNALAAAGPNDIWAVGGQGMGNGAYDQNLTEHWSGSSWGVVASPNSLTGDNDLWGVSIVPGSIASANNTFAVGDYFPSGVGQTRAMKWDGTNWITLSTPNVGSGDNELLGVVALSTTNVWAVGSSRADNNSGTPRNTLIEQYNGATWSVVSSPDMPPISSDRLMAVAATAANDVWAVGRTVTVVNGSTHPLIEHYNGTSWSIVPAPSPLGGDAGLYGVSALTATSAWAVGYWTDTHGFSHNLVEKWDGTNWSVVVVPTLGSGTYDNLLFSVAAVSDANVWVAGAVYSPTQTGSPSNTLVEHWDGTQWKVVPSPDGANGSFNELNAIVATSAANVWVAGDYLNSSATQQPVLFENLCIPAPTVTGIAPLTGNSTGGTSVRITGTDLSYATGVSFGANPASSFIVDSNTQITATSPAGTAGTVDVTVTTYGGTSATSTADTYVHVPPAVSWKQYSLTGNNGSTWVPIGGALTLSVTPSVDSNAILSGNADLWTGLAGVNQDLGIFVSGGIYGSAPGQLVGWKESGGNGGTNSPNAAFVQTVIPVLATTTYTVTLEWKANHATTGTIYAAGGAGLPFSPTRLTAELVPSADPNFATAVSTSQYGLTGNNGSTWVDIDGSALAITNFTPAAAGSALISANSDLWTQNSGVNQDIGIFVSGGAFGSGQIVGWKESGGNAGTNSPNAAFAQTVVQFAAATSYTIKIRWKANKLTSGTIRAGAGLPPTFSPTRLTLRVFPGGVGIQDATTNSQYSKANSTGSEWIAMDPTNLKLTITTPTAANYILSGNADLWTANSGVNQDIGIMISGGAFGTGALIAWKESGGYAGTNSPNAAFVQTVIPLAATTTYTVTLVWKANHATTGTIFAAAGLGPQFSPTRLTAQTTS
jgi:IPT/TIG domain-containing protein